MFRMCARARAGESAAQRTRQDSPDFTHRTGARSRTQPTPPNPNQNELKSVSARQKPEGALAFTLHRDQGV